MPKINQAGLDLIKHYEGCVLTAYPDPASGGEPWTIGYGHTNGTYPGQTITQVQAEDFLQDDLIGYERCVNDMVDRDLTPNQFAALVSFAYNLGCEALRGSTLMQNVNAGNFAEAASQFGLWVYAGSPPQVMQGLVRRRAAEAELFSS